MRRKPKTFVRSEPGPRAWVMTSRLTADYPDSGNRKAPKGGFPQKRRTLTIADAILANPVIDLD